VSNAGAAVDLVTAVRTALMPLFEQLSESRAARGEASDVIEAVIQQINSHFQDAEDLAVALEREATALGRSRTELAEAITARVTELDESDGAIAKAQTGIEAQREAIETDLQNIVKEADKVGNAVKSLVTGILTKIGIGSGDSSDKDKDKDKDKDNVTPVVPAAPEDSTITTRPAGDDEDGDAFPVEAVGAASDAVTGSMAAGAKFRSDNAKLAALYQQLARMNGELAIAQVVGNQAEAFAHSLRGMADDAGSLQRTWASVASGFGKFNDEIENMAEGETLVTTLLATLNVAVNSGWSRLGPDIQDIKQAFAGDNALIPPGGRLTG
jgi:hypothetical protein